jgi:sigma-B regulation protein RsbU (phosphoserine phosphatase)
MESRSKRPNSDCWIQDAVASSMLAARPTVVSPMLPSLSGGGHTMTRLTYYRIKNAMIFSILVSNLIGVAIARYFTQRSVFPYLPDIVRLDAQIDKCFLPASLLMSVALILIYERPIRSYLKARYERKALPAALVLRARQRLLNEPFFLIGLSFCMWLAAAMVYSGVFWAHDAGPVVIRIAFLRRFETGLITVTLAFFLLEFILQRSVIPYLFPDGGLSAIPGTMRIRIRTKLTAFLFACNIVPLVSILQHTHGRLHADESLMTSLGSFQSYLAIQIFVFMAVGIWLTLLVSSNLTKPLQEITHVLREVQHGLFETRVRVTSNDEIGYTGDVINAMTEGLIERDQIKQSLSLAKEIQQNLLPKDTWKFDGFDIAGKSEYCDETGGDYFDFIHAVGGEDQKLGVVIGDVSGHGISSALLMATVRSALRQRAFHPGSAAQIIFDVNRQIVQDTEPSCDFVTLLFLIIDMASKELTWVQAGHDPAILYDPASDTFEELGGSGVPLGVDGTYIYGEQKGAMLSRGRVILLGTDGIWEAPNLKGNRFGKEAVYEAVRRHHQKSANEILDHILSAQVAFQGSAKREDDATLVVIKTLQ